MKGHQNNPQTPRILPSWDRAPQFWNSWIRHCGCMYRLQLNNLNFLVLIWKLNVYKDVTYIWEILGLSENSFSNLLTFSRYMLLKTEIYCIEVIILQPLSFSKYFLSTKIWQKFMLSDRSLQGLWRPRDNKVQRRIQRRRAPVWNFYWCTFGNFDSITRI